MSLNTGSVQVTGYAHAGESNATYISTAAGQIYPTFLCRVAALPIVALDGFKAPLAFGLAAQLEGMTREHMLAREQLSGQLHIAVGLAEQPRTRAALIRVRRELYNGRVPTARDMTECEVVLDATLLQAVHDFCARILQMEGVRAQLSEAFARELGESRRVVAALARNESVARGLLLSAPILYGEIAKLHTLSPEQAHKRLLRIERGVLRYVTRAATKTSPFSAFCEVTAGSFRGHAASAHLAGTRTTRSGITLNKGLYPPLRDALIARPLIRGAMIVEVNTTLQRDADTYTYLQARGRKEAVQRLRVNTTLAHVLALAAASPAPTMDELCECIASDPAVQASPDSAREYVEQLVSVGLLSLHFGFSEQSRDWDARLHTVLSSIDDDDARIGASLLGELRILCDTAATADSHQRESLFIQMRGRIDQAFEALGAAARVPHGLPCYEDVAANALGILPRGPELEAALDKLTQLCAATLRFAWPLDEQARMRTFFDRCYGPGVTEVPLLAFYEDYHREVVIPEEGRRQKGRAVVVPQSLDDGSRLTEPDAEAESVRSEAAADALGAAPRRAAATRLAQELGKRLSAAPSASSLAMSLDDLDSMLGGTASDRMITSSISLFCHVLPPEGGQTWRIVTNGGQLATGFGKYFSRFLHVLDPAVTEQLAQTYAGHDDQIIAEILDDGNFNANLHPSFLQDVIEYPTRPSGSGRPALRCADLRVARSAKSEAALELVHGPSGRAVIPVDLGFMNPRMRPALFRLLSHFQPVTGAQLPLNHLGVPLSSAAMRGLTEVLEGQRADAERLRSAPAPVAVYRPRIVFAEQVIVARRRWLLSATLIPAPATGEAPDAYFRRIQAWRSVLGLPAQVFVRRAAREGIAPQLGQALAQADDRSTPDEGTAILEEATPAPAGAAARMDAPGDAKPPQSSVGHRSRRGQDDYKPQFVDFEAPLLVDLFGRLILSWETATVALEECLPGPEHAWVYASDRVAVECVIQIEPGRSPSAYIHDAVPSLDAVRPEPAHA